MLAAAEPLRNVLSTTSGNPTPEGQLTTPFVGLMRKIYRSQSEQSLNPKELYNTFVKKYTYFKPYTQQDAQEFMRFLLEGLKGEVPPPPIPDSIVRPNMKRTRRRTLVTAGTEDGELHDKSGNSEIQGTYIDQLFGGKLASYVVCDVCKSVHTFVRVAINTRCQQATRISKTFHFRFMMLIHHTYGNVTDFEHSSSEPALSVYLTNKNTPNQSPRSEPLTKMMSEEWHRTWVAIYPLEGLSNPGTNPNDVVSTKAIAKKLLLAGNSQSCPCQIINHEKTHLLHLYLYDLNRGDRFLNRQKNDTSISKSCLMIRRGRIVGCHDYWEETGVIITITIIIRERRHLVPLHFQGVRVYLVDSV